MSTQGGRLAAIGLLAGLCACSHDYSDPALDVPGEAQPLVFGQIPSRSSLQRLSDWAPVLRVMSEAADARVYFKTARDYIDFVRLAKLKEFHFVNASVLVAAMLTEGGAFEPLLEVRRRASPTYGSILIARASWPSDEPMSLRGKRVGFVTGASASGHVFPLVWLGEHGLDPHHDITSIEISGHDNIVHALHAGEIDAGFCFDDCRLDVERELPSIMTDTKVLARIEGIPADLILVRSDLPAPTKGAIAAALVGMRASRGSAPTGASTEGVTSFEEVDPARLGRFLNDPRFRATVAEFYGERSVSECP